MSFPAPRRRFSFRDYLDLEETSNVKHEFFDGEIYAMAGGTPEHAALSMAIGALLFARLDGGPCRVYSSDLRVRSTTTGLTTYPDVTVVCGELERDPEGPSVVTNPTLVVEVLSPSTEDYDRGDKLAHYREIASLRQIVLVAQDRRRVETWSRAPEGWHHRVFEAQASVALDAIGATLAVDELYDRAGVA